MGSIENCIILNNIKDVYDYFKLGSINNPFTFYSTKFIINDEIRKSDNIEKHSIRIWKSNTLFNYWYNEHHSSQFVAALDYNIRENDIKIEYLSVNDDECCYTQKPISQNESEEMIRALVDYMRKTATELGKPKVIIDVHSNLRIYNKSYKNEGFQLTGRKCEDNPYWEEVEMTVS